MGIPSREECERKKNMRERRRKSYQCAIQLLDEKRTSEPSFEPGVK